MNTNKIIMSGLIGTVVAFLLGWLVYGMLLHNYMSENMGSATGVMKGDEDMNWIALILGHVAMGMLLALIYGRWANISTFATGAKAGAVIGFLMTAMHALISLGTSNIHAWNTAIIDMIAGAVITAIVGGVVAWFLGRE